MTKIKHLSRVNAKTKKKHNIKVLDTRNVKKKFNKLPQFTNDVYITKKKKKTNKKQK